MSSPVLYSYFRSSASWRVRIALAYKSIDYEYKAVSLIKDGGQQHLDEYKSVNPMEQVPTLVIDGSTLTQSLPIIEYLEETRPDKPKLLPSDAVARHQARAIAEMINSGIQPVQNLSVLQHLAKITNDDSQKSSWGLYWIEKGLKAVEQALQTTAGKYCVGNDVTIADLALVPQVYNAKRFKVEMSQFPTITRIVEELVTLDAFKAADPTAQPDCPDDLKN